MSATPPAGLGGWVGCASDWRPGGRRFDPRRGQHHSFVEIDHEIFSTVILSLPLIQEGQLSVSGERMCTILVNRLEDKACPVNVWLGKLTALDMTPLGWLGRKTSTQTKATPPTVLYHSHWNYADILTIIWRYAYAFYRILKLLFFFFFYVFHIFNFQHNFFMLQYYESAYSSRYLVSTNPPTVLSKCFWNFTGILLVVWGYTCALGILKLCFFYLFFLIFFHIFSFIFFPSFNT